MLHFKNVLSASNETKRESKRSQVFGQSMTWRRQFWCNGGHGVCDCAYWLRQHQWGCLSPSADGASCKNGLKEERTVRPQRGCCTRKLFTMLFWTSSSAEVKRRLRKTASYEKEEEERSKSGNHTTSTLVFSNNM